MSKRRPNRSPFSEALGYAYRLLGVRERSEKEMRERLMRKGYDVQCVEGIVETLKGEGLVDDSKFVRLWAEDRAAHNPKGIRAIKQELLKKGIEGRLVDDFFKDPHSGYDEYAAAKKAVYGYLARRGFSHDVIEDIVEKL